MMLMPPINGHVTMNFRHGSTAEYSCDMGYVLNGPSTTTCFNGRWVPFRSPTCEPGNHQSYSMHSPIHVAPMRPPLLSSPLHPHHSPTLPYHVPFLQYRYLTLPLSKVLTEVLKYSTSVSIAW